jgi:hypothetical protein
MTKLTEMCATTRRNVARKHRVEVNILKLEIDQINGYPPRYFALKAKVAFHTAQAKLWEAAAAQAEANGFVRV